VEYKGDISESVLKRLWNSKDSWSGAPDPGESISRAEVAEAGKHFVPLQSIPCQRYEGEWLLSAMSRTLSLKIQGIEVP
jgi:hypothetical protein